MMPWSCICFLAAIFLLAGNAFGQSQPHTEKQSDSARPVLLFVHGCCQDQPRQQIFEAWKSDLVTGLERIQQKDLIRQTDVQMLWYADLFEIIPAEPCRTHESKSDSVRRDFEFLSGKYRELTKVATQLVLQYTPAANIVVAPALHWGFPEVDAFFRNLQKRCQLEGHVIKRFRQLGKTKRSVVVVAHSLGSLLMYDLLYDYNPQESDKNVSLDVVTLGSPRASFLSACRAS